jgi:hypothetical protein
MSVVEKAVMVRIANRLGVTLLADNAQWTNRFNVRSESSNKLYTVAQRKSDGSWGCDCMGWKRHKKCKHLAAMMPALGGVLPSTPKTVR